VHVYHFEPTPLRIVRRSLISTISLMLLGASVYAATPESTTVLVNCSRGESINKALEAKGDELIVEIRGICTENVAVTRNRVTLRGRDPALDGIRGAGMTGVLRPDQAVIRIDLADDVTIEKLSVANSDRVAILVIRGSALLKELRVSNVLRDGIQALFGSFVDASDVHVSDSRRAGIAAFGAAQVFCTRCDLVGNRSGLFAVQSSFSFENSTVQGAGAGIGSFGSSEVDVIDSTVQAGMWALLAEEHAILRYIHQSAPAPLQFSGSIAANEHSNIYITGPIEQTSSPGWANVAFRDSAIHLRGGSKLISYLWTGVLSRSAFDEGASLNGTMACYLGSDTFCAQPELMSGPSLGCSCQPAASMSSAKATGDGAFAQRETEPQGLPEVPREP